MSSFLTTTKPAETRVFYSGADNVQELDNRDSMSPLANKLIVELTERHAAQIEGVLSCWDRMLIFGTLPGICYAGGMTSFLFERKIKIFDYPKFAEPFRNRIRENAEKMA